MDPNEKKEEKKETTETLLVPSTTSRVLNKFGLGVVYGLGIVACVFVSLHIAALHLEEKLLLVPQKLKSYKYFNVDRKNKESKTMEYHELKSGGCVVKLKNNQQNREIVLLHGNAGSIDDMAPIGFALKQKGYNVLLVEYYGFGCCHNNEQDRKVSAQTLLEDVKETWSTLVKNPKEAILAGFSMGGGCIGQLLDEIKEQDHPAQVVLINTYCSLPQLVQEWLPFTVMGYMMKTQWKSEKGLKKYKNKNVIVVYAIDDELIGNHHAEKLIEISEKNGNKTTKIPLPNGGHSGSFMIHLSAWTNHLLLSSFH